MTQPTTQSKPGDRMADGTIYAGISPSTWSPMYTTPADAPQPVLDFDPPLAMDFNEAAKYPTGMNRNKALGHDDWRLPTKAELKVLFNNRAAIGQFDVSNPRHTGWYWSSSREEGQNRGAWGQRFSDGITLYNTEDFTSSVRTVRCDP